MADHHGAAAEVHQAFFQRPQGGHIEVVGRFVEQQQVAAARSTLARCTRLRSPPDKHADLFLLLRALEIEART